jgi:hypothetical protein
MQPLAKMKRKIQADYRICHWPTCVVAVGALCVGTAEYLLGRAPESTHVGRWGASWIGDLSNSIHLFGPLGAYLPDFIHPFAFILLTVAVWPKPGPSAKRFICLGWLVFDLLFEIGQRYGVTLSGWIAMSLPSGRLSTALADYFGHGTFSPGDLVAITLGALAGYLYVRALGPGRSVRA